MAVPDESGSCQGVRCDHLLDLEELLGCRVQAITVEGLNPDIRDHVLREAAAL